MGVAELKKVELYYHKSVQENVAKTLQHSGACQIIAEPGPTDSNASNVDRLLDACEEQETHLRYLFRALRNHFTDPVSSIDRMLGERLVLSMTDLARISRETDLAEIASSVKKMETALNELRIEVSQLKVNSLLISRIKDFPYSLDILGDGTRTLKGVFGTVPQDRVDAFRAALKNFDSETELFFSARDPKEKEKDLWCVLMYARAREQDVLESCVRGGMIFVELPSDIRGSVPLETERMSARLAECEQKEAEILDGLKAAAEKWMPTIQQLSDYWGIMSDRYRALSDSGATEHTVRTNFWVPAEAWGPLQKQLEAASPNIAFAASVPVEEDNPPTLLKNKSVVQPFEILTNLYSPPPYGEVDPTPLLAPYFFLFFGMCLGDAGYAIVMIGAIWALFRKYRRIPKTVKDFIMLFAFGAVSTFLYGVISGSFFGDFIDAFPFMMPVRSLKNALMIVDPMKNPMQVLGLSLFLGLIHLMFGLGVGAYDHIRKKNYLDAVGDKISWIFFIMGLALVLTSSMGLLPSVFSWLGKVMALLGAATIFWYAGREKKGILSKFLSGFLALYGSTSYLGDVLSYSRLLALGFGSAVIGMIINLLGGMAAGIPYVGWVVAIAVVAGGHIFGLAINILGAFVHSLRLQYVEFFGKFYSGGGTAFTPLSVSTTYVEVSE